MGEWGPVGCLCGGVLAFGLFLAPVSPSSCLGLGFQTREAPAKAIADGGGVGHLLGTLPLGGCSMPRAQPVSSGLGAPTHVVGQGRSQAGAGSVGGHLCWTKSW